MFIASPRILGFVERKKRSRVYNLSRSLKRIGRSVGRLNRQSIAREAMKDERIRSKSIEILSKRLAKETKTLCSKKVMSTLRKRDLNSLQEFDVSSILNEMEQHAPSVLTLLRGCLLGRKHLKVGARKTRSVNADLVVAVCCAILLRGRSQRMNLLQRIVSIVLYCGHASKRVSIATCILHLIVIM